MDEKLRRRHGPEVDTGVIVSKGPVADGGAGAMDVIAGPDTVVRRNKRTAELIEDMHTRAFGFDMRGLAAMRIGCGSLMLLDLWWRSADVTVFYTDAGFFPRERISQIVGPYVWSIYNMGDGWAFASCLMCLHAVAAFCMTIGFRTTVASVASWVLLLSLHNRNIVVEDGGDMLLMNCMFFGTFLFPWGARWSVDNWQNAPKLDREPNIYYLGAASFGYYAFICVFYAMCAINKLYADDTWHGTNGSPPMATWMSLHYEMVTTHFGNWVRENVPKVMLEWATLGAWWLELLGMLVLLSPWKNSACRTVTCFTFIFFHFGILAMMDVGIFPLMDWVTLMPFFPVEVWNWVEDVPLVQVRGLLARIRKSRYSLVAPEPEQRTYRGIEAVHTESYLKTLACIALTWYIYQLNVMTLIGSNVGVYGLEFISQALRIDQRWNMFAPYPFTHSGYLVVTGFLEGQTAGDNIDLSMLLVDGTVNYDGVEFAKPSFEHGRFRNYRWTKLVTNMYSSSMPPENLAGLGDRLRFAQYYCEQYAEEQPRGAPLMGVSIYYMREVTPKGHYGPRGQPERLVWARWECKSPGDEANAAIAEAIQHVRYANNYRSRQPGPQHASVQSTMPDGGEHHPRAPAAVQAHTGIAVASEPRDHHIDGRGTSRKKLSAEKRRVRATH